jgi:hypothetical protein
VDAAVDQTAYNSSRPSPMAQSQTSETTRLLRDWAKGDKAALDQLTPRVYRELRRIAGHLMQNERAGRTIQTTALAHEAYLKLVDVDNVDWQHRATSSRSLRRSCGIYYWMRPASVARPGGDRPALIGTRRYNLIFGLGG